MLCAATRVKCMQGVTRQLLMVFTSLLEGRDMPAYKVGRTL